MEEARHFRHSSCFCERPVPSEEARRLDQVSRVHKYTNLLASLCFRLNFLLFNLFVGFKDGFFEE